MWISARGGAHPGTVKAPADAGVRGPEGGVPQGVSAWPQQTSEC